jgi:hypothetical protein
MKLFHNKLVAAVLFASVSIGAAHTASAEILNVPVSASLVTGDYANSHCVVVNSIYGITSTPWGGGSCELQIPIEIPVGRTIQQIEVTYTSPPDATLPFITAYLGTLDFTTAAAEVRYSWSANTMPGGPFQVRRLMQQTKFGYPDAFVVQASTMYQVYIHLENGESTNGVRVTYQ